MPEAPLSSATLSSARILSVASRDMSPSGSSASLSRQLMQTSDQIGLSRPLRTLRRILDDVRE